MRITRNMKVYFVHMCRKYSNSNFLVSYLHDKKYSECEILEQQGRLVLFMISFNNADTNNKVKSFSEKKNQI